MRDIKFRAWDEMENKMIPWEHIYNYWGTNILIAVGDRLMQYTGFRDRKNFEAYDSDLYERNGIIWEVYWDERAYQWRICANGDKQYDKTKDINWLRNSGFSRVGNRYENPELIKR